MAKFAKPVLRRLKKHYAWLTKLSEASGDLKEVKKILKKATVGQILALAEIILNILRRNVPLTVTEKRILCPFRNRLREIASKKNNCERKRKIFINQKGGILGIIGTILGAAIPAIKGLISAFTG